MHFARLDSRCSGHSWGYRVLLRDEWVRDEVRAQLEPPNAAAYRRVVLPGWHEEPQESGALLETLSGCRWFVVSFIPSFFYCSEEGWWIYRGRPSHGALRMRRLALSGQTEDRLRTRHEPLHCARGPLRQIRLRPGQGRVQHFLHRAEAKRRHSQIRFHHANLLLSSDRVLRALWCGRGWKWR